MFQCAEGTTEQRPINLSTHNFIIPLNEYEPGCKLEPAETGLFSGLAVPGLEADITNVHIAPVEVAVGSSSGDMFFPEIQNGTDAILVYVEGSGYMRYKGTIDEQGVELNVDIDLTFSPGWLAFAYEADEESLTIKMYQVPVNSLKWERGQFD